MTDDAMPSPYPNPTVDQARLDSNWRAITPQLPAIAAKWPRCCIESPAGERQNERSLVPQ